MDPLDELERAPLRERIYRRLLSAIVSGDMAPGERIRDKQIAAQLNVSRTPVREALQRLAVEGLVETRPGSMTRVSEISPDTAGDVFPVLAELHALAVRLAVPRLSSSDLERMRELNREMDEGVENGDVFEAMELDTAFHNVPVEVADNGELSAVIQRLEPKARRIEFNAFGEHRHASAYTHEEIVAACEEGDVPRAEKLVRENWLHLGERLRGDLIHDSVPDDDHPED